MKMVKRSKILLIIVFAFPVVLYSQNELLSFKERIHLISLSEEVQNKKFDREEALKLIFYNEGSFQVDTLKSGFGDNYVFFLVNFWSEIKKDSLRKAIYTKRYKYIVALNKTNNVLYRISGFKENDLDILLREVTKYSNEFKRVRRNNARLQKRYYIEKIEYKYINRKKCEILNEL